MKQLAGGKQMRSLWMDVDVEDEPQDIWTITTPAKKEKKYGKHPTQKPVALLERIILASSDLGDTLLDPFTGSSTTGVAAIRHGRSFIGMDTALGFLELSVKRLKEEEENLRTRPRLAAKLVS